MRRKLCSTAISGMALWWFSTAIVRGPNQEIISNWSPRQGGFYTLEECNMIKAEEIGIVPNPIGTYDIYTVATACWKADINKKKVQQEN